MDLHPIFVHIPIAFLSVYAVFEILSLIPKVRASSTLFTLKSFLLAMGFIGAVVAASAGDTARFLNREFLNNALVETHEEFAGATEIVFGLLSVIYMTMIVTRYRDVRSHLSKFSLRATAGVERVGVFFFKHMWIVALLAIAGLALVTITAALGGGLVYGTESKDPFIGIIVDAVCGIACK